MDKNKSQQNATRAIFFISGFGTASWAPLVPVLKTRLVLNEDVISMMLLCIGIGSLITMPLSGTAASRFGCKKVLTVAGVMAAVLLIAICEAPSFKLLIPTLLLFGGTMGCIDVVQNIQAVFVEKASGHRVMSGMYAPWSIGSFCGAGLFGVWVGLFGFSPFISTLIAAIIMITILKRFRKDFLPHGGERSRNIIAIPKGVVALVGVIICIAFLVEGAIMDWGGVLLTVNKHFDISLAGTAFAVFSAAMFIMRLIGDGLVQTLNQKFVVLCSGLLAIIGFLMVIFSESLPFLYAGFFLIGFGSANIIPIFFSLLGKQNVMPVNMAVPAVCTLGYLGVLMGPALIGFIGHYTNLFVAFGFMAVLLAVQMLIAIGVFKKVL